MFVRSIYTARELWLHADSALSFVLAPANVGVTLRAPSDDEIRKGYDGRNAFCICMSEHNIAQAQVDELDRADRQTENVPWSSLPSELTTYVAKVKVDHAAAARQAIRIVRWRANLHTFSRPLAVVRSEWSSDRDAWRALPTQLSGHLLFAGSPARLPVSTASSLSAMAAAGNSEPVYHELFREAWEHRHSNPRSSLILGIASIEVAVRQLIADLIPASAWIVARLQTPPVGKLLRQFIPTLKARSSFGGSTKPPPTDLIRIIERGVEDRNEVAHAGKDAPPYKELEELLLAVRDCMWLFDYYRGFEWAKDYIRAETLASLRSEPRTA